jgi:hypothetical protein
LNRRELIKSTVASLAVIPAASAQEVSRRTNGLPPLTIKDCKVITTNGGSHYRWVFLKILDSTGLARPITIMKPWLSLQHWSSICARG